MAAFRDGEEDILCVVAGWGPTPTCRQPGAQYKADGDDRFLCNEHHVFSLNTSERLYSYKLSCAVACMHD